MTAILTPPILTTDQKGAIQNADNPDSTNVFLTHLAGQKLIKTINDSWTVGTVNDDFIYFVANISDTGVNPALRYNKILHRWEFSNGNDVYIPFSAGGSVVSSSYVHQQAVASNSWTVLHNLGSGVVPTITDQYHNVIIPNNINIIDGNSLVISFSQPMQGYAYIIKSKFSFNAINLSSWVIPHHLNTYEIAYAVYDQSGYEIQPQSATLTDKHTLSITFNAAVSGTCQVVGVGYEYINGVPLADWNIGHNLGMRTIAYMITDSNHSQILPNEVILTNDNSVEVQFATSTAGDAEIVEG